jgi:hypothetical protein
MRNRFILLFVIFFSSLGLKSQQFSHSVLVNHTDSFLYTSSAFVNDDIIKGSLETRRLPVGSASIAGEFYVGRMALRRMDTLGNEIWHIAFPNSKGRIFDIQVYDNKIIIGGAYFDTLVFSASDQLVGDQIRHNDFIAAYDLSGNYLWSFSSPPNLYYSKFLYRFYIRNNKIYYPYSDQFQHTRMQVLSLNGDSLNNMIFSNNRLIVSDMELDKDGNLYLCGSANFDATLGGDTITHMQSNIFYMTFLAKLDTNLQQIWSKGYNYVTFDYHPEIEIIDNQLAFLYNHIGPQQFNSVNYYALSVYALNGGLQQKDSIGEGSFSHTYRFKSLYSYQDNFYYTAAKDYNKMGIFKVDNQLNHTMFAFVDVYYTASDNWLKGNGNKLYLNMSYNTEKIVVNGADTIYNNMYFADSTYWNHQQLMLVFDLNALSTSITSSPKEFDFSVYPNPTNSSIFVQSDQSFDQLSLISVDGRLLFRKQWRLFNGEIDIAAMDLDPGIYFLVLEKNGVRATRKIVLQK